MHDKQIVSLAKALGLRVKDTTKVRRVGGFPYTLPILEHEYSAGWFWSHHLYNVEVHLQVSVDWFGENRRVNMAYVEKADLILCQELDLIRGETVEE